MTDDLTEIFGVVAEFRNQAPILMEAEGEKTSRDSAYEHMEKLLSSNRVLRACVVRLEYDGGNALTLHDMKRIQK